MFGKLKEKLKGWIKKSSEDIEEKAAKIEKPAEVEEKPKKEDKKKLKKVNKEIAEVEKQIQEAKTKKIPEAPKKFDTAIQGYKPDTDKIREREEKGKLMPQETVGVLGKDEAEILSEKPAQEVAKVLEQKPDETSQDVAEKIDKVKEEAISEEEAISRGDTSKKPLSVLDKETTEKKGFFSKVKSKFSYKIDEKEFNSIFEGLEMLLLENNVALEVVEDIEKKLSEKLIGREIKRENLESEIKSELKKTLNEILIEPDDPLDIIKEIKKEGKQPFVILFFGINGTGKTTTIAKLTNLLKKNNLSVVLAAADTFRAASIEQIQIHADKLKVPLIKHDYYSDPSAVGFDAIKYAKKHKTDVVLIDTAGRMHTKTNLIAEMEKICRVTSPNLKIFVAESIAGNDATEQAKTFHKAIEIDGSILSKADIDEKGGTIISVSHATNKPIFYLGTGQEYKDIQLFNKQEFIKNLGLD